MTGNEEHSHGPDAQDASVAVGGGVGGLERSVKASESREALLAVAVRLEGFGWEWNATD